MWSWKLNGRKSNIMVPNRTSKKFYDRSRLAWQVWQTERRTSGRITTAWCLHAASLDLHYCKRTCWWSGIKTLFSQYSELGWFLSLWPWRQKGEVYIRHFAGGGISDSTVNIPEIYEENSLVAIIWKLTFKCWDVFIEMSKNWDKEDVSELK